MISSPSHSSRQLSRLRALRPFLPALFLLIAWVFSTGCWIVWQGRSPSLSRAVLGKGVILVNWGMFRGTRGIGRVTWQLGTSLSANGVLRTWYVHRPLWSPDVFHVQVLPEIYRGHVKVPLIYFPILAVIPPTIRRLRKPPAPNACPTCGYDLRGLPADSACPECGKLHRAPDVG